MRWIRYIEDLGSTATAAWRGSKPQGDLESGLLVVPSATTNGSTVWIVFI